MKAHLSVARTSRGTPVVTRRVAAAAAIAAAAYAGVACSHPADVVTAYPASRTDSGAVEVVLNDPSRAMSVTVNDALVVDHRETRKVHIDGIPTGSAHVRVATGGRCEHASMIDQDVTIIAGQTSTIALPGPEPGLGCMIFSGLDSIAGEIGEIAIVLALGGATVVHFHH